MEPVEMTAEVAAKLRTPFPPEAVGKLPRVWCGKCREANKQRRPSCDEHTKKKCQVCKNNITEAHLHLDYVGHAEITDRLLQADPFWTWEPFAIAQDGTPLIDGRGGLWMRLTVAGVTRIGYGHADGKDGPDAIKEAIGDGLRNCAMRFGVGLDLWGAHGAGAEQAQEAAPAQRANGGQKSNGNGQQQKSDPRRDAWLEASSEAQKLGMSREEFEEDFAGVAGVPVKDGTVAHFQSYAAQLRESRDTAGAAS